MTVKELEQKLKAEGRNPEALANCHIESNYENIKMNPEDQRAHESMLYLRGLIKGLTLAGFINEEEYDSLLFAINTAYRDRKREGRRYDI